MRPVRFGAAVLVGVAALSACSGSSKDASIDSVPVDSRTESGEVDDNAPTDRRPEVRSALGAPDAFEVVFDELDGEPTRQERWTYLELDTVFEFLDGELLWTTAAGMDELADGTLAAHFLDPDQFRAGMSLDAVTEIVRLAEIDLTEIDLADAGVAGAGARMFVGPQLMVAFADDRLVSVETFASTPEPVS